MLIGYMRVSKSDGSQVLDLQRDALLAAGVTAERIYEDRASGRKDDRPGLVACLKALQPGNTLVIWKLDRLGRDLKHLVNTIDALSRQGVGIKVLAGAGAEIDTTTANGRLVFSIFAALAEFENELIRERTMAGLAAARARGRLGGRPRKMTKETLTMAMSAMVARDAVERTVAQKPIPAEALIDLRRRLDTLPSRSPERRRIIQDTAALYGLSEYTLYRALRVSAQPQALQRTDRGIPRILPKSELDQYCEIIRLRKKPTPGC